jgi:hypothetical protein
MADLSLEETELKSLVSQYLSDDDQVAELCLAAVDAINAGRLFEKASVVEGSVVVKSCIARINTLLHHSDPRVRCECCEQCIAQSLLRVPLASRFTHAFIYASARASANQALMIT